MVKKKLEFCYKRGHRKIPVYRGFDVDVVLPACNFIENYTLAQTFFFKFCEFYQAADLLKKRIWQRCYLVNFTKILRAPFLKPPVAASDLCNTDTELCHL